jgi:uncharacterized damage-inducible protein DinB
MQNKMIWFDRKFDFALPAELFPMTVDRLRGAPVRLEEKISGVPNSVLIRKIGDGWSIKEQIGHLWVVEQLWIGRMDDYLENAERLRPADLENTKTKESNFNSKDVQYLLSEFRNSRNEFIMRLDSVKDNEVEKTALHPRLDKPMRIIDLAYFAAEHDDHHLSRIHDLIAG